MQTTHPLGVTSCQVVIHCHDVHSIARKCIQVDGERRDQGLSFTGLHFCDPSKVKRHSTHKLDVKVTLSEHSPRRFSHHGVGLDQEIVKRFALG